jgi:fermentation-respiration switch protein FrsA (DUF1100 family)
VARYHFPWLPTGLLLRDRYDTAAHLAGYPGRVGIVVAGRDTIIPAPFGRLLYEALAAGRTRLWTLAGAGHNDWPERVGVDDWRQWAAYLEGASVGEGHPAGTRSVRP